MELYHNSFAMLERRVQRGLGSCQSKCPRNILSFQNRRRRRRSIEKRALVVFVVGHRGAKSSRRGCGVLVRQWIGW